jgi:cobalamin biosynthesis protein CbiG
VNQFVDNSDTGVFWVGVGCNSKTEHLLVEMAVEHVFKEYQLLQSAMPRVSIFDNIAGFATIDNKATLIEFCAARNLPLKTFSAEVLKNVIVPHPSQVVALEVGTPSVAEAAAILACRAKPHRKEINNCNLIIPKQVFRTQGLSGVVTIAVARVESVRCKENFSSLLYDSQEITN